MHHLLNRIITFNQKFNSNNMTLKGFYQSIKISLCNEEETQKLHLK